MHLDHRSSREAGASTSNTKARKRDVDMQRWFGEAKPIDTRVLVHEPGTLCAEAEAPAGANAIDFMALVRAGEAELLRQNPNNRKALWMALAAAVVLQYLLQQPRSSYGQEPDLRQWGHVLARTCTKLVLGILRGSPSLARENAPELSDSEARAQQRMRRARHLRPANAMKHRHGDRFQRRLEKRVAEYERLEGIADRLQAHQKGDGWKAFPRECESLRRHWDRAIQTAVQIGWAARGRTDARGRGEGPLLVGPRIVGAAIGFRNGFANLRTVFVPQQQARKRVRRGATAPCAQSDRPLRPIRPGARPISPQETTCLYSESYAALPSEEQPAALARVGSDDGVRAEKSESIAAPTPPVAARRIEDVPQETDPTLAAQPFADADVLAWMEENERAASAPKPAPTSDGRATDDERAFRRQLLAELDAGAPRNNPW